ncbi:MAG: hypothetical protein CVT88_06010 [Candidatus Altiarchaeales archaeon HGW-Altiarchaeales-1]|nr:MAG: hypothetical protein CVT88_06010 [Candidatus Altiarchaeales archaeon HGW-Altiarchaeales-1]
MGELTESERVEIESKREIIDSVPKVIVYGGISVMVWIFTMLVYIPLGGSLMLAEGLSVANIIMIVGFVALVFFTYKILREIRDIANAIGGLIAVKSGASGASKEEVEHMQTAVRGVVYAIVGTIMFVFLTSVLRGLNIGGYTNLGQMIVGIGLVVMFIWVIFLLYRSGMAVSKELEKSAHEKAAKMLEEAAKD